jgi:protein TonB
MKVVLIALSTLLFLTCHAQENSDSTKAANATPNDFGDQVFQNVEEPAMPVGGYEEFYRYIGMNLQYPKEARQSNVTGKVIVEFVVEKDGSISRKNIKILKSPHDSLSKEAIRLLREAPKWNPGKEKGVTVRTKKVLPITFNLG